MVSNPYIEACEGLGSAVDTLPDDFLDGNAAKLHRIVRELEGSHGVAVRALGPLRRLDLTAWRPGLLAEVRDVRVNLEEYEDYRGYQRERTHCSNIYLIANRLAGDTRSTETVQRALKPLYQSDKMFIDELEELLPPVIRAAQGIESELQGRENEDAALAKARRIQEEFLAEYRPSLEAAKRVLDEMTETERKLVSRL